MGYHVNPVLLMLPNRVMAFLARHPEFKLVTASEVLGDDVSVVSKEGYLVVLPHVHGADGAFGARMQHVG